ncbi:MAG: VIT domain-containing protein [Myxococcota bacterium]
MIDRTPSRLAPVGALLLSLALGACGGEGPATTTAGSPLATLEVVRGEGDWARLGAGEVPFEGPELARLRFDSGPRVLLESATLLLSEEGFELQEGRAFVDAAAGDRLDVSAGGYGLTLQDARVSITPEGAYVVAGVAAARRLEGGERLTIAAGESLTFASGEQAPVALWQDWTGGLAQAGPGLSGETAIGALEGRVPDEIGRARWPLTVRRLDVRVRVVNDLAITEVDQVFFNPASEAVEGIYRVRVPEAAVLGRFAVDRNGRMVDGYVREKAQARQAYERQVYRGSTLDPALLEWVAPGSYKARIYPIAPGAERRITIRYAEWLERTGTIGEDAARVYRYPMVSAGEAPHIEELSLEVDLTEASTQTIVAGHGAEVEDGVVRLRQSDVRPRADFVLELDDVGARPAQVAWRAPHRAPLRDPNAGAMPDEDEDDYLYVPLRLPDSLFENAGGETGANAGLNLVVVADVSAATEGRELELGRGFVESLAAHLGENDQIAIVASDVGLRGSAELGAASPERVNGLLEALAREPSGGASDLGRTFEQAAALASAGERKGVVIYVGDGAPTVGETASGDLLERIERLPSALRAYAVAVGGESALDLLASVTRGGGMALRVETLSGGAEAALRILGHARRPAAQRVRIELSADQVFPRRPVDVVQGAVLPVVARASEATPTTIRVRGGRRCALRLDHGRRRRHRGSCGRDCFRFRLRLVVQLGFLHRHLFRWGRRRRWPNVAPLIVRLVDAPHRRFRFGRVGAARHAEQSEKRRSHGRHRALPCA